MLKITVQDVDFEAGVVRVIGKGRKQQAVPLHPELRQILESYLRVCPPAGPEMHLFPISVRRVQQLLRENLLPKLSQKAGRDLTNLGVHGLRHTFAVLCLLNGIKLNFIQQLLGHEDIRVTQIYTMLDLRELLAELEKYFPLRHVHKSFRPAPEEVSNADASGTENEVFQRADY